jgi:WD40 repeat protein
VAARFDAFISYSRSASSGLAVALRNGIERFAKPWYRLRSSRVFLDDATMSANTGLWSNIERGLTEADWFILLCSPKSAESQYVTQEVTWWLEHKTADRILLVLDEGEMFWDPKANDFDWKRSTAVNRALSKAFPEEPRWVEMPWFEAEGSLGTADPRFNERVADLASAIRGMERDELIGENVQQRRRALRLARGGVIALSGLLVASLVATVIAVINGNAAAEQARIALARQLAAQAITLSATDLQTASLLAVEAQRMNDDAQTRAALFQLATTSPALVRTLPLGALVKATALALDGTVFTGDVDGAVLRWDGQESRLLADLNAPVSSLTVSDDGTYVAMTAADDTTVRVTTPGGDTELTVTPPEGAQAPTLAALSPDGSYLAVTDRTTWLTLFSKVDSANETYYQPVGTVPYGGRVGFGDGELTTFNAGGDWARISLEDASVLAHGFHLLTINGNGFAVSHDGAVLAGSPDKSVNYSLWDTRTSLPEPADGDPGDRVTTSTVAGSQDLALDDIGERLAVMVDGAIYVSQARSRDALPSPPVALLGAGRVVPETLAFRGDTLVSGTGDSVLVWNLDQVGRITTQHEVPVPEGCSACGPHRLVLNPSGTRAVMSAIAGAGPVVVDLDSGDAATIDDGTLGLGAAGWWDEQRVIVASAVNRALYVVSPDLTTAEQTLPIVLAPDAVPWVIRADPASTVTVLSDDGSLISLDATSGRELSNRVVFEGLLPGPIPVSMDVAPDQSTAMIYLAEGNVRLVEVSSGEVLYESSDADGAAYDASSRLHVFSGGAEVVLDASGAEVGRGRVEIEQIPAPALSPDGRLVASGGTSGAMSLLDVGRGGAVFGLVPVPVQDGRLPIAAFTPDGRSLVTSIPAMDSIGRPSTISTMTLVPADWRASACAIAGRDLTTDEWSALIGTTPPDDLGCDR